MNVEKSQTQSGGGSSLPQFEAIARSVCARLAQNQRVRRNLPAGGRLRFDRQLPFLCVYRSPPDRPDAGTRDLVTTEAAYLFVSGGSEHRAGLGLLCQQIIELMKENFGTFLLLEIWSQPSRESQATLREHKACFEIVCREPDEIRGTIETLSKALSQIKIGNAAPEVTLRQAVSVSPPGLTSLIDPQGSPALAGCCTLGLAVRPIFRNSRDGTLFPMVLASLRWQLSTVLRKTIAQFTGILDDVNSPGTARPPALGYHVYGPSSLVKAAQLVDHQLCELSESFDFLLQVTPTNADRAWEEFRASGYVTLPKLHYRPLPYRPSELKRQLYAIPIERIEDPTLAQLFWEKQAEMDCQLTALRELDNPRFLYSSLQLYGDVEPSLRQLALDILKRPTRRKERGGTRRLVPFDQFIERARAEIFQYRNQMSEFKATVEVCDAIAAGIMVSQERLLVAKSTQLAESRVEPLLHHEIGTHLLTYFNGRAQPFRQLYAGLAGYEELQEGLAVLAEFLVGGLSCSRTRTLAGRVIAVSALTSGATFVDTFEQLHQEFKFTMQRAFTIALRVYRGGGLTKDAIYLRGLRDLLTYLARGHDIEPLYVGKIGLHHIPYVQELRRRNIIVPPRVLPRFLNDPQIIDRLEAIRGMSVSEILEHS